jgi:hypothetical protein
MHEFDINKVFPPRSSRCALSASCQKTPDLRDASCLLRGKLREFDTNATRRSVQRLRLHV